MQRQLPLYSERFALCTVPTLRVWPVVSSFAFSPSGPPALGAFRAYIIMSIRHPLRRWVHTGLRQAGCTVVALETATEGGE